MILALERIVLKPEQARRRRRRSLALGLLLAGLAALFYIIAIYRIGGA